MTQTIDLGASRRLFSCPRCERDDESAPFVHGAHGAGIHGCTCDRCQPLMTLEEILAFAKQCEGSRENARTTKQLAVKEVVPAPSEGLVNDLLARDLLISNPSLSNREVGRRVGIAQHVVARIRREIAQEERQRQKAAQVEQDRQVGKLMSRKEVLGLKDLDTKDARKALVRVNQMRTLMRSEESLQAGGGIRSQVNALLKGMPRQTFDPHGFCVYLLWGEDEQRPLYVGQSVNVTGRIGNHMAGVKGPLTRSVEIVRCETKEQMCELELCLIALYQPPLNIAGK